MVYDASDSSDACPLRPGEVRIQTGKLCVEMDVDLGNRPRPMGGKFAVGTGLP